MKLPSEKIPRISASSPPALSRVQLVHSFQELAEKPFAGNINALCWKRTLPGDFAEIVACLGSNHESMITLDPAMLRALSLSAAGQVARECMLADFSLLSERQLAPVLNCIYAYPRDDRSGPIATDVFSFHVDSAPCETDTWLCTYYGQASEGLCNEQAQRLIDIPATRTALLAAYGGSDDAGFQDYLTENAYDLHFAARPSASSYSFGIGNLWRIATAYPGCPVPPSIHRAPPTNPGDSPRLLLIS
jgi:hypothetical protein